MFYMIGSWFIAVMQIGSRRRMDACFTRLILTRVKQAMRLTKGLCSKPYQ